MSVSNYDRQRLSEAAYARYGESMGTPLREDDFEYLPWDGNVSYDKVDEVRGLIEELTQGEYAIHPHLMDARFLILWRAKAQQKRGRITYASVGKTPAKLRSFCLSERGWVPHFLIEVAADMWQRLGLRQKVFVIDHELSHCRAEDGEYYTVGHAIEEFPDVVARHGSSVAGVDELVVAAEAWEQMELDFGAVREA